MLVGGGSTVGVADGVDVVASDVEVDGGDVLVVEGVRVRNVRSLAPKRSLIPDPIGSMISENSD